MGMGSAEEQAEELDKGRIVPWSDGWPPPDILLAKVK